MAERNRTSTLAKNTILLYIRMFLLMFIGLFTSRVTLQTLGIEDFGAYNVVSGFVAMFSILSGSLANAISRFYQFEIGRGNADRLKIVFSVGVNVQICMAILVFILAEIIGYWFLCYKMNVPPHRLEAVWWVLHCSIFASVVSLISVPYNAAIIAHEKMSAFAYVSLLVACLKLGVTYSLFVSPFDKLKTFSILLLIVSVFLRFIYGYYCKKHFDECHYEFSLNKPLLKEMSSFAGWNLLGNGMVYVNNQGINLLINVYFGVAINAARGIAFQVNNAIQQLITNFVIAAQPQITKSYAEGNRDVSFRITCISSKFAFFLTFFFALPIMVETDKILQIWLKTPPDYSVEFIRWTIATSCTTVISNILYYVQMAHGDIKLYQILTSIVNCVLFPASWIGFSLGLPAIICFIFAFIISCTLIIVRFYVLNKKTQFPFKAYMIGVVCRCFFVAILASILPLIISFTFVSGWSRLIFNCIICCLINLLLMFYIGINKHEQKIVTSYIKHFVNKSCHAI